MSWDGRRISLRARDRGRIDLLPFLHALLESPPGQPLARPADPNLSGALARTRVKGEVQLGDGTLARGGQRIELAGRAAGKNRCTLDSPSIAQRLVIGVPQFAATAASLALPDGNCVAALDATWRRVARCDSPPAARRPTSIELAKLQDVAMVPGRGGRLGGRDQRANRTRGSNALRLSSTPSAFAALIAKNARQTTESAGRDSSRFRRGGLFGPQ